MVFFSTLILFVIYWHTITSEWIQLVCHISTVFFFRSAHVFSQSNKIQYKNPNCNGRYDEFNEYLHLNPSYLCTTIPPTQKFQSILFYQFIRIAWSIKP